MKRFSLVSFGFVGLVGSMLAGCPIFSDGGDGNQGGGIKCFGDSCGCTSPADCPSGETCGSDGTCHGSDCSVVGCPSNYKCTVTIYPQGGGEASTCVQTSGTGGSGTGGGTNATGGSASTSTSSSSTSSSGLPTSSSSSSGAGGSGAGGSATTSSSSSSSSGSANGGSTSSSSAATTSSSSTSGGPAPVYCGHPADCGENQICGANGTCVAGPCANATNPCILGYACQSDGTCQPEQPGSCDSDANCTSGSECIAGATGTTGGTCTVAANQCFDQSQCPTGDNCVSGKCVPACVQNSDCRDGYLCNTVSGVCTTPAQTCTITNDCGSATLVCVAGVCVPRSAGGACNPGDVWTENGCIPNQAATFTCSLDGTSNGCASGSICLHHDCWISCDSPNQNACSTQAVLNQCKPVTDNGTTYDVCGSSNNLGNQCGAGSPTNASCTGGKVCIDGYCK